jgi:hypothetical protein
VIEGNALACLRVGSLHSILFAVVAVVTGVSEIVELVAALGGDGLNVIYGEGIQRERLR